MSATDAVDTKDPQPAPSVAQGRGSVRGRWGEKAALPIAWLVLFVVFAVLAPDTFLSMGNIANILGSQSILFMLALAALLPTRSGDLDLSLGSIGGLSAILVAVLNVQQGVSLPLACLVAVAVGALCGAFNGLFVVKFKTEPFIMTLGTGTLFGGLVFWIANSTTIVGVDRDLSMWTYLRQIGQVPVQFYYCLLVMLVIWYVMNYTPLGVRNLFVGQSREVAVLSGINADRIRFGAFTLAGVIASLAGILYVGTTGSAGPTSVETFLLPAYAAVFLGATTIQPGRFNALGTGVAVLFLATGTAGLQLLGAQDYAQQLFYGGALVAAVAISRYLRRS
jgi:ribose transport system permease protein